MSILTIHKSVAAERAMAYTSLGWEENSTCPDSDLRVVTVRVKTANNHNETIMQEFRKPYLVQRSRIRRPFHENSGKLTSGVAMDYMGSAEFEFGALPMSLRRIQVQFALYQLIKIPEITIQQGRNPLRVYANFDSEQERNQYVDWLLQMRKGTYHDLKEWSDFDIGSSNMKDADAIPNRTDFWWDVRNDVMWSFDHKFMETCLQKHLQDSFQYMNEAAQEK